MSEIYEGDIDQTRPGGNIREPAGNSYRSSGASPERSGRREKDFSASNREAREGIDPETGEKVQLLTKKQFQDALFKSLKDPSLKCKIKK